MKNIADESQSIIADFLEVLVPHEVEKRKILAKKAKLHYETFRTLKNRNSLTSDTLFRLCLSHGISANAIRGILKKKQDVITNGMVEWIKFGSKLDEKELELFVKLLKDLKKHYLLKK